MTVVGRATVYEKQNGESKGKAQRRPIGAALKAQRVVEQHVGARKARRSTYIESREGRTRESGVGTVSRDGLDVPKGEAKKLAQRELIRERRKRGGAD
jgi:hypothetical protein